MSSRSDGTGRKGKRRLALLLYCLAVVLPSVAQFNTDRLVMIGRSALYYEDYVLSIQYFNQAIAAKPWLYEPWYYRAVAKYYLDDYAGSESDCTQAIDRNPYVTGIYELRGLCRIQQKNFADAITDYNTALRYEPEAVNLWHNRALCRIQQKDYEGALLELDSMSVRWSKNARIQAMKAEAYLLQKDTVRAIAALDKSIELDAYDGSTWAQRAQISMARGEWKESEGYLDKAIHLLPKHGGLYINRALARFNQNNLRGAMADYDTALDFEPNNFLGHYNRGLLRAQVGDDNRAILDFDFVLKLEPDNLMALYNRALLLEQTGNPRAAIRDYTKVIDEYPNFWTGLHQRAQCYRKLGMTKLAEQDEFRILKAQIDKRFGKQPRLSKQQMRKRSDEDIEKYNQLAVADEEEMEHEYQSDYRGRVQNRRVGMDYQPMYVLSTERQQSAVRQYVAFDRQVDSLNRVLPRDRQLYIVAGQTPIPDPSPWLQSDSTSSVALWLRAVCEWQTDSAGVPLRTAMLLDRLTEAISLAPANAYLYYDRGNAYVQCLDFQQAILDYNRAIELDQNLAEAWYNRGLARIANKQQAEGVSDLSKAGELGLYTAYSIIKRYR